MIKVAVCGALGKMGKEVVDAVSSSDFAEITAKIDLNMNDGFKNIEDAVKSSEIDVLIDFTQPKSVFENAKYCLNNGIKTVIGTTGLTDAQLDELQAMSEKNKVACLVAPNFSTGAVLMMMFAKQASKYFDNAEIIEFHHNQKKDAPSGTAVKTALMMSKEHDNFTENNCHETETLQGARGANAYSNIHVHSVRMPGFMASQEVIFGSMGQVLTIRHDSSDRKCYMQGVLLAVKHVSEHDDFIYGLENILKIG